MAQVIVTFKVMLESPDIDPAVVEEGSKKLIQDIVGETDMRISIEEIAFGLKALKIIFVMDEEKGSTEDLENKITDIEGVQSVEVTDVRRAIG